MVTHDLASSTNPLFSIIIAAYNDWESLDQCLQSLAQQAGGPSFEVIIADDGSTEPAPEFIRQWQLFGAKNLRDYRYEGGENSSQPSRASEHALVHVEDERTALDWKGSLVCTYSKTSAA